mgnify:CR=1 FL=1
MHSATTAKFGLKAVKAFIQRQAAILGTDAKIKPPLAIAACSRNAMLKYSIERRYLIASLVRCNVLSVIHGRRGKDQYTSHDAIGKKCDHAADIAWKPLGKHGYLSQCMHWYGLMLSLQVVGYDLPERWQIFTSLTNHGPRPPGFFQTSLPTLADR